MLNEWEKLKEDLVYDGYRKIAKRWFKLPNDTETDFDVIQAHIHVASILALTEDNQIILAKQFRPGPEKILYELPGGGIDQGETPEQAAARELLEETGHAGQLQLVGEAWRDGYSSLKQYAFVATNCSKIQEQKLDAHEFIEVVYMPLEEFKNHLRSGQLTDIAVGYLGLDFLKLL